MFKNVHTVSVMKHKVLTENSKNINKHIFYNPDHNAVCMTFKNEVNKDVNTKVSERASPWKMSCGKKERFCFTSLRTQNIYFCVLS